MIKRVKILPGHPCCGLTGITHCDSDQLPKMVRILIDDDCAPTKDFVVHAFPHQVEIIRPKARTLFECKTP